MKHRNRGKGAVIAGALFVFCLLSTPCHAETGIREVAETESGDLELEIQDLPAEATVTALLGTQSCEVREHPVGAMRTWILADCSDSIGGAEREQTRAMLHRVVETCAGQEVRFSVFGEQISTINDFSQQYDAVQISVDGIRYADQNAYVLQALCDAVQEMRAMDRSGCASRILLFTDGGERLVGGATVEETRTALVDAGIPVYVIGNGANAGELEVLAGLSRSSGGDYLSLMEWSPESDVEGGLGDIDRLTRVTVEVPDESRDGSRRPLSLRVETPGGEQTFSREVRMAQRALPTATPTPSASPSPTPTMTPRPLVTEAMRRRETREDGRSGLGARGRKAVVGRGILWGAVAGGALILGVLVCLSIFLLKKRNKHLQARPEEDDAFNQKNKTFSDFSEEDFRFSEARTKPSKKSRAKDSESKNVRSKNPRSGNPKSQNTKSQAYGSKDRKSIDLKLDVSDMNDDSDLESLDLKKGRSRRRIKGFKSRKQNLDYSDFERGENSEKKAASFEYAAEGTKKAANSKKSSAGSSAESSNSSSGYSTDYSEETELLYGRRDELQVVLADTERKERILQRVISGKISFGKEAGQCDWVLEGDPSISRCHGYLSVRDGELYVEDAHSTNGLWVNRRKVERRTRLYNRDLLRVGDSEFRVTMAGDRL